MKTVEKTAKGPSLVLNAQTASDLMSASPVSLHRQATVHEAIALMTDRNFDAAPIIDDNGRPIGVVAVSDILVHDREYVRYLKTDDGASRADARDQARMPRDFGIEIVDHTTVEQIMTPTVFTVTPRTLAPEIVRRMLDLNVHHLFVADDDGVLVGVISSCDILRRLS